MTRTAPPPPEPAEGDIARFPCDTCGSDLRFAPDTRQLKCDHCGHAEDISNAAPRGGIAELDFEQAIQNGLSQSEMEETQVITCENCGASTAFDDDLHAAECPFCATPVVTGTGTHRHIKPRGLLPFAIEENLAHDALTAWLGTLWFAPNGLSAYARKGRKMNGIYVPFWTFDADTKSTYSGSRGTHYYVTKTVMRDGKPHKMRVRKTRWRATSGRVARFFDDVLILASKSLPKRYTDALAPWDLSELEPYKTDYLAGFRAEGYRVELSDGYTEARAYMDRMILRDVKYDIGGDDQRVSHVDTDIRDVTFKHILLPVWLAAYKYHGKSYRFVVNGRSGKVQGERPYSVWKITFAVIIGLCLAGAIGYFAANNG
jgi:ribosomal protein S27E